MQGIESLTAAEEEATPDEQQEYETALESALKSLHSGETAKNTVGRVLNADTPAAGVAKAVFVLVRRTEEQMGGLSDSVKVQIAEDLVDEVLSLMVASERLKESEVTEEMVEDIVSALYAMYTEDAEKRGKLDKDAIAHDVSQVSGALGIDRPQGVNAMSNEEVQTRGLMNV